MPGRLVILRSATIAVVLGAAASSAASFDDGFARCRALIDGAQRLACYDALTLPGAETIEFRGKGGGLTDPFHVTTPQMLTYESDDVVLVAYLLDEAGEVVQNLHRAGIGAGQFLIHAPGTYRVQVNATGAWRVLVSAP